LSTSCSACPWYNSGCTLQAQPSHRVKGRTYSACLSCAFHYFPRRNAELEAVLVQEHRDALVSSLSAAAQTHKYLVHAIDDGLFLLPRMAQEHVAHVVRIKAGRFRGHCASARRWLQAVAHRRVLLFEAQVLCFHYQPYDDCAPVAPARTYRAPSPRPPAGRDTLSNLQSPRPGSGSVRGLRGR
jgi:hypothetical protein